MKIVACHVVLVLGLVLTSSASHQLTAQTANSSLKVTRALQNWRSITPQDLSQPDNADLLADLRKLAIAKHQTSAVVPLIKLGDPEIINLCIDDFDMDQPSHRNKASKQLAVAANPQVIPLLIARLQKDESSKTVYLGEESILPVSVAAASIIKDILATSPVFAPEVKHWVTQLPVTSAELRQNIRKWWLINKLAMEAKNYATVVPPS